MSSKHPLTDSKTQQCPKVIFIMSSELNDKRFITLKRQWRLYFHKFTSQPALSLMILFAWDAPYLCQLWSFYKRSFIVVWEWRTLDIQGRSRRRWSLWPLTLVWGQTDSVIWRCGHTIPYLLISLLALVSSCPSGLAFLIENHSQPATEMWKKSDIFLCK